MFEIEAGFFIMVLIELKALNENVMKTRIGIFTGSVRSVIFLFSLVTAAACNSFEKTNTLQLSMPDSAGTDTTKVTKKILLDSLQIDTILYNNKLLQLAHNKPNSKWPVKAAYPLPGAIFPFKRVVAFYGNFYSHGMGILGEIPADQLIVKLTSEVKKWDEADTTTPVIPAIHYVAVTAQGSPGKGGKYRLRMPFAQIDKAVDLAAKIKGIVFLDVQVGLSTLQEEIPQLEKYMAMPEVHLGIDPEYSMKGGEVPCSVVGTFDASDINYASQYLADVVQKYHLPPKILVVHRFTREMVTNYKKIITRPEVQVVMHMDGFGFPAKKIDTYKTRISNEPVQFTGFKLFYKNDINPPKYNRLMTPYEILALNPAPVYIQYQ